MSAFLLSQLVTIPAMLWTIWLLWRQHSWYQLMLLAGAVLTVSFHSITAAMVIDRGSIPTEWMCWILYVVNPCILPLMYFLLLSVLELRRSRVASVVLLLPMAVPTLLRAINLTTNHWTALELVMMWQSTWFLARATYDYRRYSPLTHMTDRKRFAIVLLGLVAASALLRNGLAGRYWITHPDMALVNFCYNGMIYALGIVAVGLCAKERASIGTESEDTYITIPSFSDEAATNTTRMDQLATNLQRLMREDRIYLRPGLRIDDVARMLGTNRTYVARLMMQSYNRTFVEQITAMRVDAAKRLMVQCPSLTMEEVAMRCGFQSGSTFNKVFRAQTGMTPLGWQNQEGKTKL